MFVCKTPFTRRLSLYALTAAAFTASAHAQQSGAQTGAALPKAEQPLQSSASTGPVALTGNVIDPDAAEIPGATVTLTPASGKPYVVQSGSDGTYTLRGVPPGSYSLTITMPGFASFVRQGVRIGETALTVNAKLAIADQTTVVNVTTEQNAVSVDQDSNASATVLKGKDLDALSDDPDELAAELSALAGPAAGPNGGQIYIDGFTGGQLPPKSSIREIRINQNPFSAQYDRPGFGRVEVFTKPGTDKLHGSAQLNGLDKAFNTGSPFILSQTPQPDYHTILFFGSVTGPINKKASYTLSGSYRDIQDNSVVRPDAVYATSPTTGAGCNPNTAGCTLFTLATNPFSFVQFTPQTRYDISPRLDLALSEKNTLTARFQYEHNSQINQGIGGNDLQTTGFNIDSSELTLQLSDTQILSPKVINETRFEFQRAPSNQTPFNTTPSINVQGAFTSGGYIGQLSNTTSNHIEVQNYTSVALAKHFLRLGGRLRTTGESSTTFANANGTFTYSSIANYAANQVSGFQITNIVQPTVSTRNTDLGVYAEDDWKVRPNFTFSYGLRFETQNYIHDHSDFAPRISGAYGIGKKTVIRAGGGVFYDRFSLSNQLSVVRNNGSNQQLLNVSAPTGTFLPATCNPANLAGCSALTTTTGRLTETVLEQGTGTVATTFTSPYQIQFNVGVDQQLFKGATVSVNFQHIRGVHQFNSDVPNYQAAGTAANPLLYELQSNGVFNQKQIVTNFRYSGKYGSVGSYYVLNYANSDTSGATGFASIPNNLAADYGRASFDVRNRFFLFGSIPLPHLVTVAPFIVAQSGNPYNITSGLNQFNDNLFNTRANLVTAASVSPTAVNGGTYQSIAGCGTFAQAGTPGTTLAPVNYCTGPANFTLNLRVAKTFGFGEKRAAPSNDAGGGGRQPGNVSRGGPGSGGGRGGGAGGGFNGGGGSNSGKRYNLTIGAQAQNLFNIADRNVPVGTFTSPSFGISNQLAGSIYTTDSAVRRITLQLSASF